MRTVSYGILLVFVLATTFALDNGEGRTPPLGFNTWNHFYCNINENIIIKTAEAIIKLGLKDVGYNYINIDDCWMAKERNSRKELVPDPTRFSHGIKALADYCHQRGLKLGIYSSAGTKTCQGLPASLGYEDIDAATWAKWGVDYLKYDNCFHDSQSAIVRYTKMRDALNKTGRHIYYSICNWGQESVWEWGSKVGNSWRTTGDIEDKFDSVRDIYKRNVRLAGYATIGGWNDPDMLEVGNGGMTTIEYKTHFSLWAMAKSPLLIGCDLTKIKQEHLDILKNKDIIALNQDKLGKQAKCVINCKDEDFSKDAKGAQITVGELEDGSYAIAVTNWNNNVSFKNVKVDFSELSLPLNTYKVKDLWANKDLGVITDGFVVPEVQKHDTFVYRLART